MVPSGLLIPNNSNLAPFVGRFFYPLSGSVVAIFAQSSMQFGTPLCTSNVGGFNSNGGFTGPGYELGVVNVNWLTPLRVQ
jgi:hypothetical protein